MTTAILTVALSACQAYAERVTWAAPDVLGLYLAACATALEVDGGGVMQVSRCVIETTGAVDCDFWQYGGRRLPFEP